MKPTDIINHASYPIDDLDSASRQATITTIREQLAADGCAVLPGFLSQPGLQALTQEALERLDKAYYSPRKLCNVFLNEGDPGYPEDHPLNIFLPRTNGFITADLFSADTSAKTLYDWQPLIQFLADCLGKPQLFVYEDPVSNMIVNVGKPGQQFNWHYDTNEFTITLLLQPAESGGYFEYVPDLRNQQDECYDDVKKVLDGDRQRVKRLELNAGDLQFFLGRYSLHQVTENTGDDNRLLLIMSFTEQPGVIGSKERVKDLYGKTTEVHEQQRIRSDALVD